MKKNITKTINWDYLLEHSIVKSFRENPNEELFKDNLKAFIEGDVDFRRKSRINSATDEEILAIINHIKAFLSRRKFLKQSAKIAAGAAAMALIPKSLQGQLINLGNYGQSLKIKGVNYDIGTQYSSDSRTRPEINAEIMQREMSVIKNQLHCNAVRICGEDINKLVECSKIALSYGLQVWLSPRKINATLQEALDYIKIVAIEAEKLRQTNPNIVFIVANELSLDMKGIFFGSTYYERTSNEKRNFGVQGALSKIGINFYNINDELKKIVSEVRLLFHGNITYACGTWEKVNWEIFDIIGINAYYNRYTKGDYIEKLIELKKYKKPIAVTEFGCGSYKDAEDEAGFGYTNVDWYKNPPEIKNNKTRDENVQANHILSLLKLYMREGIYASFPWTFVETAYTSSEDSKHDLDIASFNLIRVYPPNHPLAYIKGHIIPKKSFEEISRFYGSF